MNSEGLDDRQADGSLARTETIMGSELETPDPGPPEDSAGGQVARGSFPNTLWTVVCQAQDGTEVSSHEALSKLCEIYWYPLYAFVRRSGCSPEDAEDVTQEVLVKGFTRLRQLRDVGKFESWLKQLARNFRLYSV